MNTLPLSEILAKVTPLPWATDIAVETYDGQVLDSVIYQAVGSGRGNEIARFVHDLDDGLDNSSDSRRADAALIAHAVNMLPELVEVLADARAVLLEFKKQGYNIPQTLISNMATSLQRASSVPV